MHWLTQTFTSSIGKKALMATSGLLLGLFVLVHMLGNTTAFAGREVFIAYAEALHAYDSLLIVFELVLLAFFIGHVISALTLALANRAARPTPYAVKADAGGRTLASRSMLYSGLVVLVFLVVHVFQFKFGNRESLSVDLIRQILQQPLFALFYLVGALAVALHISHGFWSLWQSLGVEHPKYNPALRGGAVGLAIVTGLMFSLIPVAVLLFPRFLL